MQFEWVSLQGDELTTSPGLTLEDAVRDRFHELLKRVSQGEGSAKNSAANRAYRKLQNSRLKAIGRRDVKAG